MLLCCLMICRSARTSGGIGLCERLLEFLSLTHMCFSSAPLDNDLQSNPKLSLLFLLENCVSCDSRLTSPFKSFSPALSLSLPVPARIPGKLGVFVLNDITDIRP